MNLQDLKVGLPVWAQMGSYGWRRGVVAGIGRKLARVNFPQGLKIQRGQRHPDELRPRDPGLKGKDKPRPIAEDPEAYAEYLGDRFSRILGHRVLKEEEGI